MARHWWTHTRVLRFCCYSSDCPMVAALSNSVSMFVWFLSVLMLQASYVDHDINSDVHTATIIALRICSVLLCIEHPVRWSMLDMLCIMHDHLSLIDVQRSSVACRVCPTVIEVNGLRFSIRILLVQQQPPQEPPSTSIARLMPSHYSISECDSMAVSWHVSLLCHCWYYVINSLPV